MRLGEVVTMSMGSLAVNKLRSGLTMLGITIGIFSIVGVMTVITALRSSIETGLTIFGSNIFQFAKYPIGGDPGQGGRRKYQMRRNITLAEALRYKSLMAGKADVICLKVIDVGGAEYEGRTTPPGMTFMGTNEHFLAANQYTIARGRNFTADDVEMARPVIIIGEGIRKRLFPSEPALGHRIKMKGCAYTVVGVFDEKGMSLGGDADDIGVIPITRFFDDFGAEGRTINIATQAADQTVYNETLDQAITAMRIARGLRPEDENDFEIYSNDSLISAFGKIADIVAAGSFIISGIALVAAGVGIMNIMLVSVTERTKEIGIRKSIGARKKNILSQFLIEAIAISLAGGVLGILLGVAGGNVVAHFLKATVVIPWNWAAIGLVVCSGIGVAFGFYPAWKAASLDPIEALRFE